MQSEHHLGGPALPASADRPGAGGGERGLEVRGCGEPVQLTLYIHGMFIYSVCSYVFVDVLEFKGIDKMFITFRNYKR